MHTPLFPIVEDAQASLVNGTLYVVATPIGNVADISLRALAVLARADLICAEDTRVTGQLLARYGIQSKLVSVREHNERAMADKVCNWLAEGQLVAQVSDAGTPAVSDPGARLVAAVRAAGHPVCAIPGACAAVTALAASGVTTAEWLFHGFLPPNRGARCKQLENWRDAHYAVVLYEAPHRVAECAADIAATLGESRLVTLARELTKTFETVRTLPAGELAQWIASDSNQQRGECVLIIDAAAPSAAETAVDAQAEHTLRVLLAELPPKQAAKLAATLTGAPRDALYQLAVSLRHSE